MRIAIYGREFSDAHVPHISKLFDKLNEYGTELVVYGEFLSFLNGIMSLEHDLPSFQTHKDLKGKVDYLFSIGGDGTFLDATQFVRDEQIPMMGINTGRLGYLSSVSGDEIDTCIDNIRERKFVIDKRTMLKVESKDGLFGGANFALNEVTIHKQDSSAMITVRAYLDGRFLNSYWADGLIIATPTGSTAYSLSCGGPIVLPGSDNFVITPVAPHNLNVRPIVVPDDSKIALKVEGRSEQFLVTVDSRSETIDSSVELHVSRNDFQVNILRMPESDDLKTIRKKLNWGFDRRN